MNRRFLFRALFGGLAAACGAKAVEAEPKRRFTVLPSPGLSYYSYSKGPLRMWDNEKKRLVVYFFNDGSAWDRPLVPDFR